MSHKILIIDDEKNIRRTLVMILRAEGFEPIEAESAEEGLALLSAQRPELAILDVRLPGMSGIDALREMRRADPDLMVVMLSGHASIATAVEATREGAFDFLEKPPTKERVLVAVRNALRLGAIGREWRELKSREAGRHRMIGESDAIRRIQSEIARAAPTTARILITGESGTGKELVARAVHEASGRRDRPFVKVNCAAIPEELIESELFGSVKGAFTGAVASRDGKFLQADGGTLFLDEVGDMSLRAQAKVLRVLQEGEVERVGGSETVRVDVRVVAATNKDLVAEARAGRFREDLFFRLNVVPIAVPPLRERSDDVSLLARHFAEQFCVENNRPPATIAPAALEVLTHLPWRGNIRELGNLIERLLIMSPTPVIGLADLARVGVIGATAPGAAADESSIRALSPSEVLRMGGLLEARRRFEAACIRECLRVTSGNVSQAARLLGIERTNLHKKIQSFGLDADKDPNEKESTP